MSTQRGFVDDLNGAIQQNPVAAGLIGMGVVWMFFGGSRISALGNKLPSAARAAAETVGNAAETTRSTIGEALAATGSGVSDAARHVGDAISSSAEGAAAVIRDTVSAGYDALKPSGERAAAPGNYRRDTIESGRVFSGSLRENLTETLERQPLVLGALGLALGVGIACAFPTTKIEKDMMGEAGDAVKDKIKEVATETAELASKRAKQVIHDVKNEANAQGLNAGAVKEGLKEVSNKMKNVANASRESFKDRLS